MHRFDIILRAILAGILPALLGADGERVDYLTQIKPILKKRCYSCHGGSREKSGLRLDTASLVRKGGKGGAVVEPGHADQSALVERITATDSTRMPPEGDGERLPDDEAALIKRWIDRGADGPAHESPEPDPRRHWAFQVPIRPTIPHPRANWVRNPVDAFVAWELEKRGLTAEPEADRAVLLRRVYLDLIGLPPTREEIAAYLADPSPDAYERTVDRLLASPEYAIRWGRHWMDIWRYSDWYGRRDTGQHRNSRMHIWRWRDWILESIAQDKPYDQMIREMIAGDELSPADESVQRATGFLGRNYYVYNRNVWIQDTVEFVAMGFLGLTMKCARCHDHKYDPISQEDYYRLRAIFEPHDVRVDRVPGRPQTIKVSNPAGTAQIEILKDGYDRVFDKDLKVPTYLLAKGDEKAPNKSRTIEPGVPSVLSKSPIQIQPVSLPVASFYPDLTKTRIDETRAQLVKAVAEAEAELRNDASRVSAQAGQPLAARLAEARYSARLASLNSFEARLAADRAEFAEEHQTPSERTRLPLAASKAEQLAQLKIAQAEQLGAQLNLDQARSNRDQQATKANSEKTIAAAEHAYAAATRTLAEASKKLDEPSTNYTRIGTVYPRTSTGRRLALAGWIASRENPLTARVAVNHLWARHFGAPLVPTVANFGLSGKPPTHPELLDWLAVEFMEQGWSTRALHRLLVTSATYRGRTSPSGSRDPNPTIDRDNTYLWRMNTRRMEAEVVRDSMLHLAGKLDHATGGVDIDPKEADRVFRRSIYFRHTPDERPDLLATFDAADPLECFRREESILPQQALALANGALAREASRVVRANLENTIANEPSKPVSEAESAFVSAAFEQILGRSPTTPERERSLAFLRDQTTLAASAKEPIAPDQRARSRAREHLIHVLFNHNDFVMIR